MPETNQNLEEGAVASILSDKGKKQMLKQMAGQNYHHQVRRKDGTYHETGKYDSEGNPVADKKWIVKEDFENESLELDESEDKPHTVYVTHNFKDGAHYNYGGRPYHVMAKSPDEALSILKQHKDKVETHLRSMRGRDGKLLIRKSDKLKLKDDSFHSPKESKGLISTTKIINRHGEFQSYNRPKSESYEGEIYEELVYEVNEMNESIDNLIYAINSEDPVGAQEAFTTLLSVKIHDLIDARREQIGSTMFNAESVDEGRFEKLSKKLDKDPDVKDPDALAAAIGRKKYGKEKFQKMAAAGRNESEELEEIEDGMFYDGTDPLGEERERSSSAYKFTHKPGDPESEKKLADLKASLKGTGVRVVMAGRLGKDNPNAEKYKTRQKDAKGYPHRYQMIRKADASHFDVYTTTIK